MGEPCTQEQRITRIENAVGEITDKVNTIAADVSVIREKVETMTKKVDEHDRALYGQNGEVGVVAKVVQSVETLGELKVALKGEKDDTGLIADIKNLMVFMADQKDERKWLGRAVVGAIVVQIIVLIFTLMK